MKKISSEEAMRRFPFLRKLEDNARNFSPGSLPGAMTSGGTGVGDEPLQVQLADWDSEFLPMKVMNVDNESIAGSGWKRWLLYVSRGGKNLSPVNMKAGTNVIFPASNFVASPYSDDIPDEDIYEIGEMVGEALARRRFIMLRYAVLHNMGREGNTAINRAIVSVSPKKRWFANGA